MGALPILVCPKATHTFQDGQTVEIRGLSRAEAIQTRTLGKNPDVEAGATAVEVFIIQHAIGVSEAEAKAWHGATPSGDVEKLVDAIARLSGLDPDEGKADAGDSPSAKSTDSTT
jgi:hypothetical protein